MPTRPCNHWAQFKCNFGDACGFSHDGPGGASPQGIYPGAVARREEWAAPQNQMGGTDMEALVTQQVQDQLGIQADQLNELGVDIGALVQQQLQLQMSAGGGGGGGGGGGQAYSGPTMGACKHFALGKCNFGDQCKYSHEGMEGGVSPLGVWPGLSANPQAQIGGMNMGGGGGGGGQPCKHFASGRCNFGDACKYSHEGQGSVSPLGVWPGAFGGQVGSMDGGMGGGKGGGMGGMGGGKGGGMGGTKICTHFQQGRCNYGDQCKFSHECEGAVDPRGVFPGIGQEMGQTAGQEGLDELTQWASSFSQDAVGYQPY